MKKMKIKSKLVVQITTLFLLIVLIISTVLITNADFHHQNLFSFSETVFKGLNVHSGSVANPNELDSDKYESYGLDILLGTRRQLVTYTGELPQDNEGLMQYPLDAYHANASDKDYWGVNLTDKTIEEMQKMVDSDDPQSIRLYALNNTSTRFLWGFNITKIFYSIVQFLVHIAKSILDLLISAKNMTITSLAKSLGLEKLIEIFNKVFIGEIKGGKVVKLSVFMIFALISFLFIFVGAVAKYIKGSSKDRSIRDLIIMFLVGTVVIMASLNPNLTSIGTSLGNIAQSLIAGVAEYNNDDDNALWITKEKDVKTPSSEAVAYNEKTVLHKVLIDAQIQVQFGVTDVKELNIDELGLEEIEFTRGKSEKNPPSSLEELTIGKNFKGITNNLGYLFWMCDSPVTEIDSNSITTTNIGTIGAGLNMRDYITYLQKCYNQADEENKKEILNWVIHLASPEIGRGILTFILMTGVIIGLVLASIQIIFNIVIGKFIVGASIIAFPIAGPMLLSNNKSLVKYGKLALLLCISYTIRVIILSIVFDLMLYIVGIIVHDAQIPNLLLGLVLSIALAYAAPILNSKLNKLLNSVDNTISGGQMASVRGQVKRGFSNRFSRALNKWDSSQKVKKIYDENGNLVDTIRTNRSGGLLSYLGHSFENSMAEGSNIKSGFSIARNTMKSRSKDRKSLNEKQKRLETGKSPAIQSIENTIDEDKKYTESIFGTQEPTKATSTSDYTENNDINFDAIDDEEIRNMGKEIDGKQKTVFNLKNETSDLKQQYDDLVKEWAEVQHRVSMKEETPDDVEFLFGKLNKETNTFDENTSFTSRIEQLKKKIKENEDTISKTQSEIDEKKEDFNSRLEEHKESRIFNKNQQAMIDELNNKIQMRSKKLTNLGNNDIEEWKKIAEWEAQKKLIEAGNKEGLKEVTLDKEADEKEILEIKKKYGELTKKENSRLKTLSAESKVLEMADTTEKTSPRAKKKQAKKEEKTRINALEKELNDNEILQMVRTRSGSSVQPKDDTITTKDMQEELIRLISEKDVKFKRNDIKGLGSRGESVISQDVTDEMWDDFQDKMTTISDDMSMTTLKYTGFDSTLQSGTIVSTATSKKALERDISSYIENGGQFIDEGDISRITGANGITLSENKIKHLSIKYAEKQAEIKKQNELQSQQQGNESPQWEYTPPVTKSSGSSHGTTKSETVKPEVVKSEKEFPTQNRPHNKEVMGHSNIEGANEEVPQKNPLFKISTQTNNTNVQPGTNDIPEQSSDMSSTFEQKYGDNPFEQELTETEKRLIRFVENGYRDEDE